MARLEGVQMLRALAALLVLIGHVIAEAEHYFAIQLPGDQIPWTRGVDIFFVISGFIVTLSAQRFLRRPGAFLWRRFLRVAPLYYLFTSLMVLSLLVLPGGVKDTQLDPGQIISSYGFIPYTREDGRIAPVLSLGWTLNYEMFFYVIMALGLVLSRPFVWVSLSLIVFALAGAWLEFDSTALRFWTNSIVIEFIFGIWLARVWQAGWVFPSKTVFLICMGVGFCLLIVLHGTSLPRFIAAGFPAVIIVASGTLFFPKAGILGMPVWSALGDASYALYLSHRFTLRAATLLILPLLPTTPSAAWMFVVVVSLLAVLVSVIVFLLIEKPVLAGLSKAAPKRAVV